MRTFRTGIFAAMVLTLTGLAACKKSGNSPSSKTSQLSFQLQADNATSNLAASNTGGNLSTNSTFQSIPGLTFTSAIANISRFKLEAKRNGVEIEVTSKNLSNVDLFSIDPAVTSVTLDTGVYREIEIKVELKHTTDTSALPLKLKGTFTNSGGTTIPIEFDLNSDAVIKAEAENIDVNSTINFVALVHLHLNKLEAGIVATDLANATQTNGVIIISPTSNTSIYNKVLANLAGCGESEFKEHHKDGSDDGEGHH
ncbi:hypothetical protein [Mucilaginibacter sp. BT774]|uniref:hypothetical protein n=1 Tax=Mucilaginibacter sp. BT774 TaxID=3062276 RepID=UPI00267481B1|nr:hypothetical protein [Mucilaginibacter sp. BT774]MDO3624575.1 hypothetical protein [Mucilaginibacter sp. BT774]